MEQKKRECGSCTKCCEGWLSGEAYGHKFYAGRPCHFKMKNGCAIYENRPDNPCKSFQCEWLRNETIPAWMKPDEINAIIVTRNHDDLDYIELVEAGETLRSDVLSWMMQSALRHKYNFSYDIKGGKNYIGSPKFIAYMEKNMVHFYHQIDGWFNSESLYKRMVDQAKDGALFVEVGVWKGKSAAFMGVEIANSKKNINFYAIDHFKGSPEHQNDEEIVAGHLFEATTARLSPVKDHVKIINKPSVEAAELFADESIDFIYIDAAHEYDDLVADIKAWLPKVKTGGIVAGDDYGVGIHPDVKRAVDEIFPFAEKEGLVWIVKKGEP